MALLFIGFNTFYFINRKLFLLLEKEDWPALVRYLEERVIQRGKYSPRLVRLLANSYLVLSDSQAVMSFENKVALAKPSLIETNALIFGTARILGGDISGAIRFFEARKDMAKAESREWIRWYHGFSLLLNRQYEEAEDCFSVLAQLSKNGVVAALSSYFMYHTIAQILPEKDSEIINISFSGRERVVKTLPTIGSWRKEVSKLSTEIHAAAIAKYLEETGNWLYIRQTPKQELKPAPDQETRPAQEQEAKPEPEQKAIQESQEQKQEQKIEENLEAQETREEEKDQKEQE